MSTRSAARATSQALRCPICWDTMSAPVRTPCGHHFCEGCIKSAIQMKLECPTCRGPVSSHRSLRADPTLGRLVKNLEVVHALEGPEQADEAAEWNCSLCTLGNPIAADRCQACAGRRPVKALTSHTPQHGCDESDDDAIDELSLRTSEMDQIQAAVRESLREVQPQEEETAVSKARPADFCDLQAEPPNPPSRPGASAAGSSDSKADDPSARYTASVCGAPGRRGPCKQRGNCKYHQQANGPKRQEAIPASQQEHNPIARMQALSDQWALQHGALEPANSPVARPNGLLNTCLEASAEHGGVSDVTSIRQNGTQIMPLAVGVNNSKKRPRGNGAGMSCRVVDRDSAATKEGTQQCGVICARLVGHDGREQTLELTDGQVPWWCSRKRVPHARPETRGQSGIDCHRGSGTLWAADEDKILMVHCSGKNFEEGARSGLNWQGVYPLPLAALLPGRSLVSVRKRYRRLMTGGQPDFEIQVAERLGAVHDEAFTDGRLWEGAWRLGWRMYEPRDNRYVYVHQDGRRFSSRKDVFSTRENQTQFDTRVAELDRAGQRCAERLSELDGYQLVPSFTNTSGYKSVYVQKATRGLLKPYQSRCAKTGEEFGCYATAVEAALAYSKFLGKTKSAAAAIEMRHMSDRRATSVTVQEAEAAAKAEGLRLVKDANNATGFRGVLKSARSTNLPYLVKKTTGDRQSVGMFATIGEAALEYARWLGPKGSVAAAERADLLAMRHSLGLANDRDWRKKMADMGVVVV